MYIFHAVYENSVQTIYIAAASCCFLSHRVYKSQRCRRPKNSLEIEHLIFHVPEKP